MATAASSTTTSRRSPPTSPRRSPVASGAIIGVMLESHLVGGAQKHEAGRPLTPGQSITDACLSFAETVPVLENLAQAVAARRQRPA
jgi:phospho-2-dehydro-3-deoxyheptonate aldolase